MRKILFCTLILCLLCASACAQSALTPFYDAQTALLTSTDNVTLNIGAVFELNGEQFKQMTFGEVRNGDTSVRDLIMVTPREDNSEYISGFTVFVDGPNVYAFETADAASGLYAERYYDDPSGKNAILRRRPMTDSLMEMGRALLPVIETGLGESIRVSEENGIRTLHVSCSEDAVPEGLHALLTVAFRYAASLYTSISDSITTSHNPYIAMGYYVTIADGLIWATDAIRLTSAELTMSLDESGCLTGCEGEAVICFQMMNGEEHTVTVRGYEHAADYGTSVLDSANPYDYNMWALGGEADEEEAE